MAWNRSNSAIQTDVQDVYADVRTSYSSAPSQQDTQEFSLESIQQRLGVIAPAEPETVVTSTETSDIMPSSQTRDMTYQREYTAGAATKVNTKTKVAIASYAILVLALVLAVTLCSVSVGSSFGNVVALDVTYSEVTAQVDELAGQVAIEDYATLAARAAELGYIDASTSNALTYTQIETRPAQNFAVQTNWFDSLCDWLCGVFGG